MIDLVKELAGVLKEKAISPESAARFIGVSGREVRRWVKEGVTPHPLVRPAIRRGIAKIRRNL